MGSTRRNVRLIVYINEALSAQAMVKGPAYLSGNRKGNPPLRVGRFSGSTRVVTGPGLGHPREREICSRGPERFARVGVQ